MGSEEGTLVKGSKAKAVHGWGRGYGAKSAAQREMSWGHWSLTVGRVNWAILDKADGWQQEQELKGCQVVNESLEGSLWITGDGGYESAEGVT